MSSILNMSDLQNDVEFPVLKVNYLSVRETESMTKNLGV